MTLSPEFVQAVLAGIEGTLGELIAGTDDGSLHARIELIADQVAAVRE
jgi:hypothetical protein